MSQSGYDTICAITTAPGRGGVGIVRLSGERALTIAQQLIPIDPQPRHAHFCDFLDGERNPIDQGIVLYFPAPNSYTGEDVVEFQGHGGMQVLNLLLARLLDLGARLAYPGEFSERAFLNNKIDLVQAEAIADLIDASSQQAARSALRTLQGEFSRRIHTLVEQLTVIRVNVEAAIDFSDEDIDVLSRTGVSEQLSEAQQALTEVLQEAHQGSLLKEGISIVIAGKPNAGKSSLLNALSGQESAIVTDIPGTTRDLLQQEISLSGVPVHVTDTAGLRDSSDVVEQEGVRRARKALESADQILLVIDSSELDQAAVAAGDIDLSELLAPLNLAGLEEADQQALLRRTTLILNKIDLAVSPTVTPSVTASTSHSTGQQNAPEPHIKSTSYQGNSLTLIGLSAKEKLGISLLTNHLLDIVGFRAGADGVFVARERHLRALRAAGNCLDKAVLGVSEHSQLELVAEDLRLAQRYLGEITGEVSSDDLLGKIFSSFCVGK